MFAFGKANNSCTFGTAAALFKLVYCQNGINTVSAANINAVVPADFY